MEIQFITDAQGKKTAVIIPFDEWERTEKAKEILEHVYLEGIIKEGRESKATVNMEGEGKYVNPTNSINPMNATNSSLAAIARCFRLADIYVFGSRTEEIAAKLKGERGGEEQPASDIDIGIRPVQGVRLSPKVLVRIALELEDLLDAKRVDLVLLPGADPFLALNIIRGELIYTEDVTDQARYELYVLRRAGDLLPHKKARIEMIMEENGR